MNEYTTADYLNQLEQDRQDLVDNLETKGISGLSGDETFTELVPEVLNINVEPDLESKSITITENTTTTISPTSGKDGLSQVEVVTNIPQPSGKITITQNGTDIDVSSYATADVNVSAGADLNDYFIQDITYNTTSSDNFGNPVKKYVPTSISDEVTSLKYCFAGIKIPVIDVSNLDISNVLNISGMFKESTATEITGFSGWNTSRVLSFGSMFYKCINLTELDCSSFEIGISNTLNATQMFQDCKKLAKLDISKMDLTNLMSFTNMFLNCGSQCSISGGAYAGGIPYVYVKDATQQNWVLTENNGHPSSWTTNNVVIK